MKQQRECICRAIQFNARRSKGRLEEETVKGRPEEETVFLKRR